MNYLSFQEFVEKYRLKIEATSNLKIHSEKEILNELDILAGVSCGIYMRNDKLTTTAGRVNLHPTKGTHWVMFVNEFFFNSYGCPPPLNRMSFINKGIYSEYQFQTDDSYCAVYCLYVFYITQSLSFKNAVLNLYYQK